jgi:IclR family transcriptional regulator, pca regulon regulatory protein
VTLIQIRPEIVMQSPMSTYRNENGQREDTEVIESLDRGLNVIEHFGPKPMTLSDVAKAVGLPRATARRILKTLERRGLVAFDGKLFQLTPRVLKLASAYLSSNQIVAVVQPLLDKAAAETREVCSMAVLDGQDAVFVARASPARVFSAGIDIGYRLPAYCTSVGRVLLGRLSDEALAAQIAGSDVRAHTPFTLTDAHAIIAAVAAGRAKGYSLVDQEAEPGFRSIAVPVRRYDGEIVAAINIGAHVDRIAPQDMLDRFLPALLNAAEEAKPLLM